MLTPERPTRVAVLCSGRAPGLLHLLDAARGRGCRFEIACVITSETGFADRHAVEDRGAPVLTHPIRAFYESRSSKVHRDFTTRQAYDRATVGLLDPHAPDLVLLDGYLYLVTRPMLDAFPRRMLNLHFSDLTIRRADHRPAYIGIHAVRDALADGQTETRATVHLVNDEPDGGAPVVHSWPYPVAPLVSQARSWSASDLLKAYTWAHQEWMIRSASGPLLTAALDLVSSGAVDLDVLGDRDPASAMPWLLDEHGRLTRPRGDKRPDRQRGSNARTQERRNVAADLQVRTWIERQ